MTTLLHSIKLGQDCELYDPRNDSFELNNLAENPEYAATVQQLDTRLMAELKATADPRIIVVARGADVACYVGAHTYVRAPPPRPVFRARRSWPSLCTAV
jgi:hypothetical protein